MLHDLGSAIEEHLIDLGRRQIAIDRHTQLHALDGERRTR